MGGRKRLKIVEQVVLSLVIWGIWCFLKQNLLFPYCPGSAATAAHLISQLDQAAETYYLEYGSYPAGDGTGTRELVEALSKTGPRGLKYFEFSQDMLNNGHVINPVWPDGDPTVSIIYYRLNQRTVAAPPVAGGGGGGGSQPPVMRPSKFDLWCAGCDYTTSQPATQWSINNW